MNICTRVDGWWGLFLAFAGAAFPLAEYNAKLSGQFSRKMLFRAAYLNIYTWTTKNESHGDVVGICGDYYTIKFNDMHFTVRAWVGLTECSDIMFWHLPTTRLEKSLPCDFIDINAELH